MDKSDDTTYTDKKSRKKFWRVTPNLADSNIPLLIPGKRKDKAIKTVIFSSSHGPAFKDLAIKGRIEIIWLSGWSFIQWACDIIKESESLNKMPGFPVYKEFQAIMAQLPDTFTRVYPNLSMEVLRGKVNPPCHFFLLL